MTTPREEKSISQPEISPKAREAADAEVQLWLCRDKQEPGIHVQQLLNASAAQQREEIAALTKERDAATDAERLRWQRVSYDFGQRLVERTALRAEIAALKEEKERLRERCGELAGYNVRDAVEKLALRTEIAALKETERLIRITVQAGDRPLDPEVSSVVHKMFGLQREVFALEKDRDALRARLEEMRGALERHHNWHMWQTDRTPVYFGDTIGQVNADEYQDSELYEVTTAALASEAPDSTRKEGDEPYAHKNVEVVAESTEPTPITAASKDRASDGAPSSNPTDAPEVALPNMPCQMCGGSGHITHGPHGGICSDCHGSGLLRRKGDAVSAQECNCGCHNKGPHAYHFEDCPMRDHPESVKFRLAVVEEDRDHTRKTLKFWLDRMHFWEGKFRIVKHENNALRRKLRTEAVATTGALPAAPATQEAPITPHAPGEETPETDAMERVFMADDSSTPAQTFEMCMDFARCLERRLRAAIDATLKTS